jgi:two-component system OmpR family sensor kinase
MSGTHPGPGWSLSRRLIVRLSLGLGALWLVSAGAAAWIAAHETNEVFDSAMQETAQRLLPLALDDIGDLDHGKPVGSHDAAAHDGDHHDSDSRDGDTGDGDAAAGIPAHREYLIYQIRAADGRVLLRSHDAPEAPFPAPLMHGFTEVEGGRFYTEVAADGSTVIQVSEKQSHRRTVLVNGLTTMLAPLLLLLPLVGAIILFTVRGALQPLGGLRQAIAARGGSNLEPIAETGLPDELAPIVRDVNRMIERLGAALESERAFAANSAHEMRTPVAAALAQVQRLGAELAGRPEQPRALLERVAQVEGTLRRLANRVAKLLQLARADSGQAASSESADLLPVLHLVIDEYTRSDAAAGRIRFDAGKAERLPARIDIDAFAIAFRNLLENALIHGDPAMPVRVAVGADRSVRIINGGAVVPPDVLEKLTQRFVRGQTAAEGSGLGLAIAEKILRQAGGRLALHSPATGSDAGFEAVMRFG